MRPVVALVGPPNSGKTTLYNWLTESKFKVVNYPGSTIEYAMGHAAPRMKTQFTVIDTPGTYSLAPKSADEEVTLKVLTEEVKGTRVTHVIVVIDGTQISRHLPLALQVKNLGLPVVVVVTMNDLLKKSEVSLEFGKLEEELGCPVVKFDGLLGEGLFEIPAAIERSGRGTESKAVNLKSVEKILLGAEKNSRAIYRQTEKIDKVLLHPFWGLISL